MTGDEIKTALVRDLLAMPGVAHLCETQGFRVEALTIVRFHDRLESTPWFYRNVETVAYIGAVCDGGQPIDPQAILSQAREDFGSDVSVLW